MHPHFSPKFGGGSASYTLKNTVHAYDFVIKKFVVKRGIICARPCILEQVHQIPQKNFIWSFDRDCIESTNKIE